MEIYSPINDFFEFIKTNLNNRLTKPIKEFVYGFKNMANTMGTVLLFVVDSSEQEQISSNRIVNYVQCRIAIQISDKTFELQNQLLTMYDEFSDFIYQNNHIGQTLSVEVKRMEIDVDDTLTKGLLVMELELQI